MVYSDQIASIVLTEQIPSKCLSVKRL